MAELQFDTGLEKFTVNGAYDIYINPVDPSFIERFYNLFDSLEGIQKEKEEKAEKLVEAQDYVGIFDENKRTDTLMRNLIDDVFGTGFCEATVKGLSMHTYANGFPIWANLVTSILDLIDERATEEQKKMNPRIEKYTAKYSKYQKRFHR